jgi:putative ABC transport system permease protein
MRFSTLVVRNLTRRPSRSLLTSFGLAIGIAAVVVLTAVAWGFERSFLNIYESKGIDLVVTRAGVTDQLSSSLDQALTEKVRSAPGVKGVAVSLLDAVSFEEAGVVSALVSGWEPGSLLFRGLKVTEGRMLGPDDERGAVLGRVLAATLGKSAGDDVEVAGERFHVVGIYESTSLFENGGLTVRLKDLQEMMGREGKITAMVVSADDPEPEFVRALGKRIEAAIDGLAAVPARDFVERDAILRLAKAMAWATWAVALVLGSVGMLNTMAMSVFERTREIGTLRALGWKRRRVVWLVMGEALALGVVGAVLGVVLGFLGLQALTLAPTSRGFVTSDLPPGSVWVGAGVALILSLLGGLLPAIRASRLDPTEALRHE